LSEILQPFPVPPINYDDFSPNTYPHVLTAKLQEGGWFSGIGALHFETKNPLPVEEHGWQYKTFLRLLAATIPAQSEKSCDVLIEGNVIQRKQIIDESMSFEQALNLESECGMLVLQAKRQNQELDTWDFLLGEEMDVYINEYIHPTGKLPADFLNSWQSPSELTEWLFYHEHEKVKYQWLRHYERGTELGNPADYIDDRLAGQGVYDVVEKYRKSGSNPTGFPIDTSPGKLFEIHKQACTAAGLDEPLPFDPYEAERKGIKSKAYSNLHFPKSINQSADNYFNDQTRLQRLGGISGRIFRNRHGADTILEHLAIPRDVVAVGGGQHIVNTLKDMYERGGIVFDSIGWHIGVEACNAFAIRNS
jgi:hypothetical protein